MAGAWNTRRETKATAASSLPISRLAKPMKLTISPTVALPSRCSTVPSTKIEIVVMVLAARVITETSAHQLSTGNWWSSTWRTMSPNIRASLFSRVKDCTTTTLDSASWALPASWVWKRSTWPCAVSVFRMISPVSTENSTTSPTSSRPIRQFIARVSGISTTAAMKVDMWSRKKLSHMLKRLSEPDSITFISRPDCTSPWKDSGSDSTCWKKRPIAASRLRCAIRSASRETATLAPMPESPTAAQSASSASASPQTASRVM